MVHKIDLVEPDLSYKLVGIIFDVHNTLGVGHKEKHYQRALAEALRQKDIQFKEQVPIPLKYGEKIIGRYYVDFLVEGKVVLELKQGQYFAATNIKQANDYLKVLNLKLALLVNFTDKGARVKRIVNLPNEAMVPKQD